MTSVSFQQHDKRHEPDCTACKGTWFSLEETRFRVLPKTIRRAGPDADGYSPPAAQFEHIIAAGLIPYAR